MPYFVTDRLKAQEAMKQMERGEEKENEWEQAAESRTSFNLLICIILLA